MSPSAPGYNLGDRHGRGQSGLVRRLRADRRFGERRRDAVGVHPRRPLGGCRRHRRGGDVARFATGIGHQLCRARGQRAGRTDPGPVPRVNRTAGDAAHRVDRASSTRGMGCPRRPRHDRCAGRGQHRLESARQHTQTSTSARADRRATAPQTAELSRPGHRIARRGHLPCCAGGGLGSRRGQGSVTGVPQPCPGRLRPSACSVPVPTAGPPRPATAPGSPP